MQISEIILQAEIDNQNIMSLGKSKKLEAGRLEKGLRAILAHVSDLSPHGQTRGNKQTGNTLQVVINVYAQRGFVIRTSYHFSIHISQSIYTHVKFPPQHNPSYKEVTYFGEYLLQEDTSTPLPLSSQSLHLAKGEKKKKHPKGLTKF